MSASLERRAQRWAKMHAAGAVGVRYTVSTEDAFERAIGMLELAYRAGAESERRLIAREAREKARREAEFAAAEREQERRRLERITCWERALEECWTQ